MIAHMGRTRPGVHEELQVAADIFAGQEVRRVAEPAQQARQAAAVGFDRLLAVEADLHLADDDADEVSGSRFLTRQIDHGVAGGEVVFDAFARGVAAPSRNVGLAVIVGADAKGRSVGRSTVSFMVRSVVGSNHGSDSGERFTENRYRDYHVPARPV